MIDHSVKGSCLAITEKKKKSCNQKPGGCIGIFYQLFDWNKRLTKKKFFSKKLLPPARGKQGSSKKFIGDEKMPSSKLHLARIANENNEGFPSAKKGGGRVIEKEQKHETRVPSLVARLMGLESIPASKKHKSEKSSFSDRHSEESLDDHIGEADKQGVDFDIGIANARHDSRPQKLQKTGAHERRTVTRFGAEALQIKSVLSQVRKYNHPKGPKHISPLKSPRVSSGKSASRSSRLIEAATKILEPGLQVTSRAKCSLTSSTSIYHPDDDIVTEMVETTQNRYSYDIVTEMVETTQNRYSYDDCIDKSLVRQTSCKTCGNFLDVVECRPEVDISTPIVSEQKLMTFIPSDENDVVLLRNQEKIITLVDEDEKKNTQSCNESTIRGMLVSDKWDPSRQPRRELEDDETSFTFKHKTQTQEPLLCGERISSASSTGSPTVDFVALNRNRSGRTRMRSPTKVDSCKFDLERKPSSRHEGNIERKGRTPNVLSKVEGTASVNLEKHRNVSSDAQVGKRRNFDASSPSKSNVKSKRGSHLKTERIDDNKVVSSTSSYPFKQKMVISDVKEERSSDNEIKTYFQRPPLLRADALRAFLEQKLKELSSQENEELATGCQPKRSTAMILQELISVLNSGHLICSDDHMFKDKDHKYDAHHVRLLGTSCNGNHLSPGSVLEASFSSSSLDEVSARDFHPVSINFSHDQPEQLQHDAELLDSATSFNKGKIGCEKVIELAYQIHRILQSLNSFWPILTQSKFTYVKEVIFNAELILGNFTRDSENVVPQVLISCILVELDTMVSDAMWIDFNGFVDCEESKNRNQLKGFLFDCVIEYVDTNFCQNYYSVFKSWSTWTKLPLRLKAEKLIQEVKSEIKKWECIVGMVPDQIIEWEMSHSFGKWIDFNIEAFETGVDIDGEVLQILIDEVVEDLVDFTI